VSACACTVSWATVTVVVSVVVVLDVPVDPHEAINKEIAEAIINLFMTQ
jgi:hypothetical protein